MLKTIRVKIMIDSPLYGWYAGMKGREFDVVDHGEYYVLANDEKKLLPKDIVSVVETTDDLVKYVNTPMTNTIQPLQMRWRPKEDITAYELAMCLLYINRNVMPFEVDKNELHFRHFEFLD